MSHQLLSLTWPINRLNEAANILVQRAGLVSESLSEFAPPQNFDNISLDCWFEDFTFQAGLESVSVESKYAQIEDMIIHAGPAIIRVFDQANQPYFFAILKGGWKRISIITPESKIIKIDLEIVKKFLCNNLEAPVKKSIEKLLDKTDISDVQKSSACKAMLFQKLSSKTIDGCWIISLSPGADLFKWLRQLRIPRYFFSMLGCEAIGNIMMIFSWLIIGKMIFQLNYNLELFTIWALLLLSVVPFKLYSQWCQCQISMNTGAFFKQRLLFGSMHLKQDEIRNQGPGQFMGRVMESEAFESMALDGGFDVIIFIINFIISLWLLSIGCGWEISLVLISWMICCVVFCLINYHFTDTWIRHFRDMTNNIIERISGYRTRIVQEKIESWHDEEDLELSKYQQLSEKMDNIALILNPVLTRGWMFLSIACIYLFKPETIEHLLISLGGILIANQAFSLLISGFSSFVVLLCSWQQVKPLFNSAVQYKNEIPHNIDSDYIKELSNPLIAIHDISYSYIKDTNFKLEISDLAISKGDRILLEGPSGGGKSTLSSIISGQRLPDTGLIFLKGYDAKQIGSIRWRRHVVLSPQFHENYLFTTSFAFNLLMGRSWPPKQEDLKDAEKICLNLGLGELLEKMPQGFEQMLGESGWQLSHGEQSRVFIARALLQSSEILIFDESFMPLDSKNFEIVMNCVLENEAGLIIVAHF
ncbi:ABC transporter, ATP-binding protein [Candidatus Magnetomorum sp. HK-1]|nr:ABC transporter, ATP-binding protein [Candidatus Magnetomorum sp. HK-1]